MIPLSLKPPAWLARGLLSLACLSLSLACDDDESNPRYQQFADDGGADAGDAAPLADAEADGGLVLDHGPGPEPQAFRARAGIDRLLTWGHPAGEAIEALDAAGAVVREGVCDELGSLLFREVPPGTYTLRRADTPEIEVTGLVVPGAENSLPDDDFYAQQRLEPGFGYLRVRDGTPLSVYTVLPGPPEDGPYPTVVNYSGYSPSRPGEPIGGPASALCGRFPILCAAPESPSLILAGLMGYAIVGVNMRGTGCSGGAYDYFDEAQLQDGYDVVEIVARQPWVAHNHVGLVGLSFPGISQLFVASRRPPSLAAIAPMSVIADTVSSTLVPGGIYNNGFALSWIEFVLDRAAPYGHPWIEAVVAAGDTLCEENQLTHNQRLDAVAKALENPFYNDAVAVPVDPSTFVDQIDVPVFLTGQWQDEQTGPHFATLGDKFTGAPVFRMTATNGIHLDGFAPQTLRDWVSFLDLYVARKVPGLDPTVESLAPIFMEAVYGAPLPLPPNRFGGFETLAEARAAFEAEDPIRVIFDSGANPGTPAATPVGTFEARFSAWPPEETVARRWYLQPDGGLGDAAPGPEGGASAFTHDPAAGARGSLGRGSVNDLPIAWAWPPLRPDHALAWIGAPLEEDLVMLGSGSADLWIRSSATDADLEVSLSEVLPDGQERLVQSGWLRASHRGLRADATALRPVKTHREEDYAPLVPGEWVLARVELMPFGHIFRAGSRIRLSVDTPGDSMADWRFLLTEYPDGAPEHAVAHTADRPSSVLLPTLPSLRPERPAPARCADLRGQPCRDYVPLVNRAAEP